MMDCNCFFFFKQKTAYEMRISDWSSDVCSSDLLAAGVTVGRRELTLQRKGASNGVAAALAEDAVLAIQGAIVIARSLDDNAVFDRAMKRIGTRTLSWTE